METYVIHVTKQCNMQCKYCYEEDKTSIYSWDEIKKFIDILVSKSPDQFIVEFLGGEPLLAWDLIRQAYEYLESFPNKQIESYALTTNGTILTDEILDYLIKKS